MSMAGKRGRIEKVEIEVPDVCTTALCQSLIQEIIKYVLVSKKILPYPVSYLKSVTEGLFLDHPDGNTYSKLYEEIHLKKALSFYSKLMFIFKVLEHEFTEDNWKKVRMVALLLGPTINCPKEVYIIKIPDQFYDYLKMNQNDKMRYVVLNSNMMKYIENYVPPSNMYVMFLKPEGDNSSWLFPLNNYVIRKKKVPVALIKLAHNPNKSKEHNVVERHTCPEVDSIIENICNLKLGGEEEKNLPGVCVFRCSKQYSPNDVKSICSEMNEMFAPTSSSSKACLSSDDLDIVSNKSCNSDKAKCVRNLSLKFDEENVGNVKSGEKGSTSTECLYTENSKSSLFYSIFESDIQLEKCSEKFIWYLCTEHLFSFKKTKKFVCTDIKRKYK